jgi:diguanylate cyclase (GGDEF)-like protein
MAPTERNPETIRSFRMTLTGRLALALIAMASLSAALAFAAQDRALARDLESAAAKRLERSVRTAERVIEEHLLAVEERYRALARTPQLRATLEVDDGPTLNFLAAQLQREHSAALIAFVGADGSARASQGATGLLAQIPADAARQLRLAGGPPALYTAVRVPLETRGTRFGHLVAYELVDDARLVSWSELCGAEIGVSSPSEASEGDLRRTVRDLGDFALVAFSDLSAERAAVRHARFELIRAGGVALVIAMLGCLALARSLVRPIRAIQGAVDRIGSGDLSSPLVSRRTDEIGDVARGVDRMAADLLASNRELDRRIGELARSQAHLASAQRLANIASLELDLQSGALSVSAEFWSLMELGEPEASAKALAPADVLDLVHPSDRNGVREIILDCLRTGVAARLDHRMLLSSQRERVMHTQLQVERCSEGRPTRLVGTIQDVTERRRAEEQIRFLAHHDSLTGLGNRRLFSERLEIGIVQARRRSRRLGIFFLDLDDFKRINDTLGHNVGDQLLMGVADRIVECLRPGDEITRGDTDSEFSVSRLGGDEFTLMLDDVTDPSVLAPIAQRVLDAIARPFQLGGHEIVISGSIGIATWPEDGPDVDTLLRNADSAMYHAKSKGRNGYQYYEQSMNAAALHRLEVESALRRAIENSTLTVHYQPRLEIATGRVVGFEALSRWRDPELGAVSPAEFVPIAEQTGLIVPLGRAALYAACRQGAAWDCEPSGFDGRVSVNVSAHQFKSIDVHQEIADALEETRINPLRLEIEITESVILHDEDRVIETLHAIREMGVRIALDDFGTGYSSLSYLRRLPVDVLKIDMAFVRGIARTSEDAALARAIIAMADALGLAVVAEGVETPEQMALLRTWGCDEMQGFLASPALPAAEAGQWLRRGNWEQARSS